MNISNALAARVASKVVLEGAARDQKKQRKWIIISVLLTALFVLFYLYAYSILEV